jgi:hypothetical protein
MAEGVIIGGWNYVIAAYVVFAGVLIVYASTLALRYRRVREGSAEQS